MFELTIGLWLVVKGIRDGSETKTETKPEEEKKGEIEKGEEKTKEEKMNTSEE